MKDLYISDVCCWAPGIVTEEDWAEWKKGTKEIADSEDAPKLEYTSPLFRRRLSQICRMTIQVVHDLLEKTGCGDIKQIFTSFRGEIKKEFSINEQLIKEQSILPASFSLSVFNAPIAQATLACKLKSGYTVAFPSKKDFSSLLLTACSSVLCGRDDKVMFIYADEKVPDIYYNKNGCLCSEDKEALAFAVVISSKQEEGYKLLSEDTLHSSSPKNFLRKLL